LVNLLMFIPDLIQLIIVKCIIINLLFVANFNIFALLNLVFFYRLNLL